MRLVPRTLIAGLTLLSGAVLPEGRAAAGEKVSFESKTIDVIMGSAAGGGTDGTTRLVGTFLQKYLPGHPTMRYRNIPGGHGAKGLNYFARVKPDGLTWAARMPMWIQPRCARASWNMTRQNSRSSAVSRAADRSSSCARTSLPI